MKSILRKFLEMVDVFGFFERDPFGNLVFTKRVLIGTLGSLTWARYMWTNKTVIKGTEHLEKLPESGVLFLSNHQTYFADVICFYHIFCSVKWGFRNWIGLPIYLLAPRARMYYVAASETMKDSGLVPRIFAQAGGITINRSWRAKGHDVKREVDKSAGDKIGKGLSDGWVVSFPQGTTSPYAPVRKGTGHLIKEHQPIVVPVVINGFRRAFDKKGLLLKKRGTTLSVTFKEPMRFDPSLSVEEIITHVEAFLEQDYPEGKQWYVKKQAEKTESSGT
ncbi:lysophospholipid acyltransferase family protein [Siphonobacter curvatus]|uniref:1-acyl-sn-glycerol-3-phosphate acyltransferase n=1 Tax=Siphonobacter curvatus TaxID=2094562 RepID=A0A2S7ISG6_9BACT|nr:lysophospholipid acyltransferase family protein [Siphonobacter curvatus]PQA60629.1 1-acyl-sn-glycerol-3-phosphate acyltransferase [Siphonobacter curvatus]